MDIAILPVAYNYHLGSLLSGFHTFTIAKRNSEVNKQRVNSYRIPLTAAICSGVVPRQLVRFVDYLMINPSISP